MLTEDDEERLMGDNDHNDDHDAHMFKESLELYKQEKTDESLLLLEQILNSHNNNIATTIRNINDNKINVSDDYILSNVYCLKGMIKDTRKEYIVAEECYRMSLKYNKSNNYQALKKLGLLYIRFTKLLPNAVSIFIRILQDYPNNESYVIYYLIGRCYSMTEQYDDALIAYNKSCDLNGNYTPAYVSIGIIHYRLSKYEDALKYFKKSLLLDSTLCEVYYNIAIIYDIHDEECKAKENYQQAINYGFTYQHVVYSNIVNRSGKFPTMMEQMLNIEEEGEEEESEGNDEDED